MNKTTLELCKELTEAHGAPGNEQAVADLVEKHCEGLGELSRDRMGNVLCRRAGPKNAPVVMLPAHMDECGYMVRHITKGGFCRFVTLGGWFDQIVMGQHVFVHGAKGPVPGVIGSKAPHLMPAEERKKLVEKDKMFIDVGAPDARGAERMGVRVGDWVTPLFPFTPMANPKYLLAKAWDDRVGVAVMIEVLRGLKTARTPNTVFGVATVQEEVGLRGATTASRSVEPDVCIVLESGLATDTPGIGEEHGACKLGGGPELFVMDASMIPNGRLLQLVIDTAKKAKIKLQTSAVPAGGTDGAKVHVHGTGVPSVVLGVPARYIHSPSGIIHTADFDATVKLVLALLKRLDTRTVRSLTH
jgi:endoglucanase